MNFEHKLNDEAIKAYRKAFDEYLDQTNVYLLHDTDENFDKFVKAIIKVAKEHGFINSADYGDAVNHPKHYKQGIYECIDVMRDVYGDAETMIFCKLNAFKYIWRTDDKNGLEDVEKANWYLKKYKELAEGEI